MSQAWCCLGTASGILSVGFMGESTPCSVRQSLQSYVRALSQQREFSLDLFQLSCFSISCLLAWLYWYVCMCRCMYECANTFKHACMYRPEISLGCDFSEAIHLYFYLFFNYNFILFFSVHICVHMCHGTHMKVRNKLLE